MIMVILLATWGIIFLLFIGICFILVVCYESFIQKPAAERKNMELQHRNKALCQQYEDSIAEYQLLIMQMAVEGICKHETAKEMIENYSKLNKKSALR